MALIIDVFYSNHDEVEVRMHSKESQMMKTNKRGLPYAKVCFVMHPPSDNVPK
jgi:hypothetical protein